MSSLGISSSEEKPFVIVFFKPDCIHCLDLLANLPSIEDDRLSKHVSFLALSISDSAATAQFLQQYTIPIPVRHDAEGLHEKVGVKRVPTVFFLDDEGVIRYKWVGRRSKEFVHDVVSEFLTTSRVPIHALADRTSMSFSHSLHLSKYLSKDPQFLLSLETLLEESSQVTELLKTVRVNARHVVDQYIVYGNTCQCEEEDSASYTLVSLLIDREADLLLERYLVKDVTMSNVEEYLESQQEVLHAYSR